MQVRMLSARGPHGYPPYPPRPSDSRLPRPSGFTPASPPRKVVTDFAAFGTARTSSVYNTAVQPSPFSLAGNKAAFGSIRTTAQSSIIDDDEEDEEEQSDGKQKVFLKEDPISLDQVRSRVPSLSLFLFKIFADWPAPTLTTWTCRLVVLPFKAHGVVLEASVPWEAVNRFLTALTQLYVVSGLSVMLPLDDLATPRHVIEDLIPPLSQTAACPFSETLS